MKLGPSDLGGARPENLIQETNFPDRCEVLCIWCAKSNIRTYSICSQTLKYGVVVYGTHLGLQGNAHSQLRVCAFLHLDGSGQPATKMAFSRVDLSILVARATVAKQEAGKLKLGYGMAPNVLFTSGNIR